LPREWGEERMPVDNEESRPAEAAPQVADPRRRAALLKLGRAAAYAVPATLGLMTVNRAAAGPCSFC